MPVRENIVILGASGFIGGRLTEHLRVRGCEVRGFSSAACDLLRLESFEPVLRGIDGATSVVFCAGVGRHVADDFAALQSNLGMVENFVRALERRTPRSIVFLSSADVYGTPVAGATIDECAPTKPDTYHGIAKLSCEGLLRINARCPVTVLRLPGVFGPGDGGRSVVSGLAARMLAGESVRLHGGGATLRDFVHVAFVAEVVERFLRQPYAGVVNVALGKSLSIRRIAEIFAARLGVSPAFETAAPGERMFDLVFDAALLYSLVPLPQPAPEMWLARHAHTLAGECLNV